MQTWPVQDAKARFSEFLETCLADIGEIQSGIEITRVQDETKASEIEA